jgi:hypothetical protein
MKIKKKKKKKDSAIRGDKYRLSSVACRRPWSKIECRPGWARKGRSASGAASRAAHTLPESVSVNAHQLTEGECRTVPGSWAAESATVLRESVVADGCADMPDTTVARDNVVGSGGVRVEGWGAAVGAGVRGTRSVSNCTTVLRERVESGGINSRSGEELSEGGGVNGACMKLIRRFSSAARDIRAGSSWFAVEYVAFFFSPFFL